MGRKSKQAAKKTATKDNNKIVLQRKKDLGVLVARLLKALKLANLFQSSLTPAKNWEHYLEMEGILSQIINNETGVKNAANSRQDNITKFIQWLKEHGAEFDGKSTPYFCNFLCNLSADVVAS